MSGPQLVGDNKDVPVVAQQPFHSHGQEQEQEQELDQGIQSASPRRRKWFAYLRSRNFWIVLVLSQVTTLCITGTNVFTTLLGTDPIHASIPAFQTFFTYVLLNIVYTSYTLYKYGFKKWGQLILKDGWRYVILAFLDVEGNYFAVLGYQYTTILSAQLLTFWTIVVVVLLSLIFLKVRYHIAQYAGIVVCCGGFGMLIASDYINRDPDFGPQNELKGDLFILLSATLYGFTNTFEEFLVSKRPIYEVLGQLAFYGMIINGVQAGIFDRQSFQEATWVPEVGGYLTGYTLLLFTFYSLAPIVFRMASAAFFNISLLTGTFWGVAIGVKVFGYEIHTLYPIAFVLIILGHFIYYGTEGVLGDAQKPWLGPNQEEGVAGVGTAKRKIENPSVIV